MAYPKLLLLHGFLETENMWQFLQPALPKGVKTEAVKLPASYPGLPLMKSIPETASDIWNSFQGATFLLGHSMGGYIAVEMALQQPHRVEGLCMFHSTAAADSPEKKADRLRAIEAVKNNKSRYVRTMINSLFAKSAVGMPGPDEMISHAESLETEQIVSCLHAMMQREDHCRALSRRSFPLYYFLGTRDVRLPVEAMVEELRQLPGSLSHFSDGTGHMGHVESPQESIEFVKRILLAHR
ncbi:MAG: alpha/beta hydrolase [Flavobacteriales bacterium]|nr:alpha/beta hydrolase [Flavobacteriales bacterium]